MRIAIDGAKGCGKSTLAYQLSKTVRHYGAEDSVKIDDILMYEDVVFDRFILSERIYRFLWSRENRGLSETITKVEDCLAHIDYYFVLYSEDIDVLVNRINKRMEKEGKGADAQEWSDLKVSNDLFKVYGGYLATRYPEKVFLIDIDNIDKIWYIIGDKYEN